MTFTDLNFLLFFPFVVIIFNLIPHQVKVWFLLFSSYVFYISLQPVYLILLLFITLCTYLFTKQISLSRSEKKKHNLLVSGITIIVLPLFFYKYFDFVNGTLTGLLNSIGFYLPMPKVLFLLPIGISFYTFMAIGYLIDVYNEDVEFESNIATSALFLSFFPIILSGPIERAGNMFPQYRNLKNSNYEDLVTGSKMMIWGYFMKLCVADRLGLNVDEIFNNVSNQNGSNLTIASILYPFQIYADLGGYSLIAIGVARCLGISVISNFNRPFLALSVSEFWRRWHISLIKWLTDYIYTPLSFALRNWKIWGIITALMMTFFISGLWHGAAVTFIVWGLLQGTYLSVEALMSKKKSYLEKRYNLTQKWWYILFSIIVVFTLFAFSQIFSKSESLSQAFTVITKIFTDQSYTDLYYPSKTGIICLIIILVKDFTDEYYPQTISLFDSKLWWVRWISYYIIVCLILFFSITGKSQFIYFQY